MSDAPPAARPPEEHPREPIALGPVPSPAAPAATAVVDDGATAELWRRRTRLSPAIASAAALLGIDALTLSDATSISLAASDEARELLDGMELRIRTLKTTVATSSERCIYSVRGPIMWSETITARANALGNEDVFVCQTASRSFDTVENRVLVGALESIARAERALRGPTGERVSADEVERITQIAAEARRWREHPRLAPIRTGRLSGRALARLRGGHRMTRMIPVLAVRERASEPFVPADVDGLADPWTHRYHGMVLRVLDAVAAATQRSGHLTLSDGALWSGPLSFRHPAVEATDGITPGLAVRGRPLLPPPDALEGAPWAHRVPERGIVIEESADAGAIVELLSPARAPRPR